MDRLKLILNKFPKSQTIFSFAYGSAVKEQANYNNKNGPQKMIDIIFCVENSREWHRENLEKHPTHYSMLKMFGEKFISNYQNNYGARCYFNTLVPLYLENNENCLIKYGVIEKNHLIDDLLNWKYLYIAGRLQKPIEILSLQDEDLKIALKRNLQSAVETALLLLPNAFNNFDFFYTIANLSYAGDFRLIFGENKQKVQNIVNGQLNEFYQLYLPILQNMSFCLSITSGPYGKFQQDKSDTIIETHLKRLPIELQKKIINNHSLINKNVNIFKLLSKDQNLENLIGKSVKQIVRKSSILQSLKNVPTAGISKSLVYSWQKSIKTFT